MHPCGLITSMSDFECWVIDWNNSELRQFESQKKTVRSGSLG
jgi:hypothetical protein